MKKHTLIVIVLTFLLGLFFLLIGLFSIKIPQTLNSAFLYKSYIFKYIFIILGLGMLTLCSLSLFFSRVVKRRLYAFLDNLWLFFIVSFLCLFILSVFIQVFQQKTPSPHYSQADPILHHSQIPNTTATFMTREWNVSVYINADGIRDDEIQDKDNFDSRILMLGDSFTWGFGVEKEERFSELLEKKYLEEGRRVDVINTGTVSYSPVLEYLYLKEKGLAYNPDVVILNFDMSDVWGDNEFELLGILDNNGVLIAVPGEEKEDIKPSNIPFASKISFLDEKIRNMFDRIYGYLPNKPQIDMPYVYNLSFNRYAITLDDEEVIQNEMEYWQTSFKYINLIRDLVEGNNATFVLVTYPYGHQISTEEWKLGRHHFGLSTTKVYSNRPEIILQKFAEESNIPFVSAFSAFKESSLYPLYFSYDGHFSTNGHKVMADIIYKGLQERALLVSDKINA